MEPDDVERASSAGATWIAADAPVDVGLAGVRAHLERLRALHELRSLTVVVDDPDLGRQAFRVGNGSIEPGARNAGPGVLADPAAPAIDADLLVALCAASLRVDVLRDAAPLTGELALRRLPGVYAVEVERDAELMIIRLHVDDTAPDDVGRAAARSLDADPATRYVVEVVRAGAAPHSTATPAPPVVDTSGSGASTPSSEESALALLLVRSVPEEQEIEAHVSLQGARAVGRAPLAHGLVGAAEAVLEGHSQVAPAAAWQPAWVRTIETTADGHFVVAVALIDPRTDGHRHGIATGSSPIEAAGYATVQALR
jgi:hypothetical protein